MEAATRLVPAQPALASCSSDPDNTSTTVQDICDTFDVAVESPNEDALNGEDETPACPSNKTQTARPCDDSTYPQAQAKRGSAKRNKQSDLDELMVKTLIDNRKCMQHLTSSADHGDEAFLLGLKPLLAKINEKDKAHLKLKMHAMLVEAAFPSTTV
ncbi:hypothetical protein MTO96_015987 [Rhipicephalus appendiculatus]